MSASDRQGIGMTSQRTRDRLVQRLRDKGIADERVLEQIGSVPRHLFIDEALAHRAYEDVALPIGHGQTISQPFVVARMTELLLEAAPQRVLEIGTGCGYQTAVLAALFDRVWTVERIAPLAERARERLGGLGVRNVRFKVGDGYEGWAANAPYDAIIVTAAPETVPDALTGQLADGGRLVIPVGRARQQTLSVVDRRDGDTQARVDDYVRFVPLVKGVAREGA